VTGVDRNSIIGGGWSRESLRLFTINEYYSLIKMFLKRRIDL